MKNKSAIFIPVCFAASCAVLASACFFKPQGSDDGEPEKNTVTVIYHMNGGESSDNPAEADGTVHKTIYDPSTFRPITASRETWLFDGWYYDGQFTNQFSGTGLSQDSGDVHLYAKWNDKITVTPENFKNYFSVTAQFNGVLTIPGAALKYEISPKQKIDPVRSTGSIELTATPVISSWSAGKMDITLNSENNFKYAGSAAINEEVEINIFGGSLNYVVNTPAFELYLLHNDPLTVTFDACGGTVDTPTISANGGSYIRKSDLPVPVREGYVFRDWYYDSEYTKGFLYEVYVDRPLTLYAKWAELITVTFDTVGGSEKQPLTFDPDKQIDLGDVPYKEGHVFLGWYFDAEYTQKYSEAALTHSTTLYAKWL